ncbi:copper amine oxidase N-terminal domain-containing protein [Bacillus tianshenii]|nr:copper amine oxidase N-terminal domain-containing protein [Bacillus tianshenii]
MNWKKTLIAVPLSVSLVVPAMAGSLATEAHAAEKPSVETPAVDLRAQLGTLLSEHAYLAVETMRKGAEGAPDFQASAEALNENTEALSKAITSVYGKEAGEQFKDIWSEHIGFFVDYVKATGNNNEAGKEEALDNLDGYKADFSAFLEKATNKRLEADMLAKGLQAHIDQLIGSFDSYVAGNYEEAYMQERKAIAHMHMVAKGFSAAIADQFPAQFNHTKAVTPAGDLRADLNYLLSEHAGLAMMAMQNGVDGSDDFQASAAALNANTEDLAAAIASIYGEKAGMQFKELWASHIGFFVDYVKGTAANDEAMQQEALNNLDQYRQDFSKFLETATEGGLESDAVAMGLQTHVNQLVGTFDSYTEKDYNEAYDTLRDAYAHMANPAKGISGAVVAQFPDKFAQADKQDEQMNMLVTKLQIGHKKLWLNDKSQALDVAPFLWNNHTFISLRALSEAVGAEVTWNADDRSVKVTTNGNTAMFWIGKDYMTFNGERKDVGAELMIRNSRTQVPLRFIAELLGWNVNWDGSNEMVTLTKEQ